MKKIGCLLMICVLIVMTALPVSAKLFADVDSYSSFTEGGNLVFNDGESVGDYWIGDWNSGVTMEGISQIAIEKGKGWNSTASIALWEEGDIANQGMYLFVTSINGISKDYSGTKYLRVWLDLTNVAFRKANFGVVDSNHNLFTTDEENSAAIDWPFYYLPEGKTEWETYYHGGDGCFGDAQDSDVMGFKGFFAFPVSDFVIRENEANHDGLDKDTSAKVSDVAGVYLFWDYSDEHEELQGNKFYLDNIEFISDYKVFDDLLYTPPVEEKIETPEELVVASEIESQTPVLESIAPQTGDISPKYIYFLAFAVMIFIFLNKKINLQKN